jgi:hypothetical protein
MDVQVVIEDRGQFKYGGDWNLEALQRSIVLACLYVEIDLRNSVNLKIADTAVLRGDTKIGARFTHGGPEMGIHRSCFPG